MPQSPPTWKRLLCVAALALPILFLHASPAPAKSATLEGTIKDEGGKAVAGVAVLVTSPNDPEWQGTAKTGRDGRFSIEVPKPKGGVVFRLTKEGYEPQAGTLEVPGGKRAAYEFVLESSDGEAARKRRAATFYNQGAGEFNDGDREAAIASFQAALELDPTLVPAQLGLAEAALLAGDLPTAAAAAAAVRRLAPDNPDGIRLAFEAAIRGDDQEALRTAVAPLDEENRRQAARVIYNRGVGIHQRQELDTALADFELAVELDPALAAGQSALAGMYYNAGRYQEAMAAAEALLKVQPEDEYGLRMRSMAAEAAGDPEAAAAALKALAAVNPDAAVAEIAANARSLFQSGQVEAAGQEAQRALELAPDHPDALFTLGLIAVNRGETAKAKELFQKILDTSPDSPRAEEAKGMLQYL